MKWNEFRYACRSGFSNLGRHPLLLIASVTTLTLMLFLMSIFSVLSLNAAHLSDVAGQQPPITVSMRVGVGEAELKGVRDFLTSGHDGMVKEFVEYSPEQNFEHFKDEMGKDELWESFPYEKNIPYTFNVRLTDPNLGDTFYKQATALKGVHDVTMETQVMNMLTKIRKWTGRLSIIAFLVLAFVASLIVANMVRVAALSRAAEISIQKYLGATNTFIQIPFVIEGLVAGFVGALLASLISSLTYSWLVGRFGGAFTSVSQSGFYFLPIPRMVLIIIVMNLAIGLILCLISSVVSVRKYAKV